jgi:hypothetical protein
MARGEERTEPSLREHMLQWLTLTNKMQIDSAA